MFMAIPALLQTQGSEVSTSPPPPIETEARAFMADYADDLRSGRRQAIVNRYDNGVHIKSARDARLWRHWNRFALNT